MSLSLKELSVDFTDQGFPIREIPLCNCYLDVRFPSRSTADRTARASF